MKTPHLERSCRWKRLSTVRTTRSVMRRSVACTPGSHAGSSRFCSCVMSSCVMRTSSACSKAGTVLHTHGSHADAEPPNI